MAEEEAQGPNTTAWALFLGTTSALIAGLIQAVLSYFTVTGFQIDWIEIHRAPVVETSHVVFGTAIGMTLHALIAGGIAGAHAWHLSRDGKLRGDPDAGTPGKKTSWSEYAFGRAGSVALVMATFAGITGFLLAEGLGEPGLAGQSFFLFQVGFALATAGLATVLTLRATANAYARGELLEDNPNGNVISRIQLWSAEHAATVALIVVLLVSGAGVGITKVDTDVDVADLLPRGDPNTEAAQNVSREFKSTFTQQVTLQLPRNIDQCEADAQRVLGDQRASEIDCGNITAEPYVRAMEELYQRILDDEENPIEYTIGLNSFYKLINWTIAGGQDAPRSSFSLPPIEQRMQGQDDPTGQTGEARYRMVDESVWTAIPGTVTPIIDPSFDQTASLFLVPPTYEGDAKRIGDEMLQFKEDYVQAVEDGETTWKIWGEDNPPLFTVDIPVANAHQSDLAEEDFQTLFPLIFGFIVVALYFSFRDFTAIGVTGATLLSSAVITYGLMGWMDIPLNTLNLTVLPLILGNGIDYAIHQTTEFAHHKRQGMTDEEALKESGGLAGFAMFIATATTLSGLLVMTISPSLLMAQVGLLAAIAMVSVYGLTITLMPALLTLSPTSEDMGRNFEPSAITTRLARAVSQRRGTVAVLVVLLTAGAVVGTSNLTVEEFGEPAQNFPEDDWLRQEHEEGLRGFYDLSEQGAEELKANIIVYEGDNTDIQAHRYMEAVKDAMRDKEHLDLSTSRTVPYLVRTWMQVKDGIASTGEITVRDALRGCTPPDDRIPTPPNCQGVDQADYYPQTRAGILHELDGSFASPLSTFASLFSDHPDYNLSIMPVSTTTGDFQEAKAAWDDVWASIDEVESQQPHDLDVAFVGNTALNYLFITEELPWLSYLGYVSGAVLLGLAALFTKRLRAVLAVGTVLGLTSVWWLGLLPAFDIGLAITLMLPAVFITSIGSDYAIHMTWNLLKNPDREAVYGVVGKAVLFSAITDIGAFAIFTQTQNVAASEAMLATVIAIGIMFAVTMMVLPIYYPLEAADVDEPGGHAVEAGPGEAAAPT